MEKEMAAAEKTWQEEMDRRMAAAEKTWQEEMDRRMAAAEKTWQEETNRRMAAATLGGITSDKKAASSRANGKKGGRPSSLFNKKYPVVQAFHTGLWGWRHYLDGINLNLCKFATKAAATRDRDQSWEKAHFLETGEL